LYGLWKSFWEVAWRSFVHVTGGSQVPKTVTIASMLQTKFIAHLVALSVYIKVSINPQPTQTNDQQKSEGKAAQAFFNYGHFFFYAYSSFTLWVLASQFIFPHRFLPYSTELAEWDMPLDAFLFALTLGGALFRLWSMQTLSRFHTFALTIRKDHELVTHGPYRYLMHPSYTGLLIATAAYGQFGMGPAAKVVLQGLFGFGLDWSTTTMNAVSVILGTGMLVGRLRREESMLEEAFGDAYKQFASTRWRLIPFLY
jgi:protein-S-isoprenylcysteine O-methyltransferase Ste14